MAAPDALAQDGLSCVASAWHAHERELRAYLRHHLGESAPAEDLLQEVFLRALRQGEAFCTIAQPRAWLFQVARHAMTDHWRAQRPQEPVSEALPQEAADPRAPGLAPVDHLGDCLLRVLGELRPDDAAIVRACDLQGQTVQAFAQAQGLSLPAAKSRLLRARERLRTQMVTACQVRFDSDGSVCSHTPRADAPAPARN
ncbi:sigma-70 family RNA polymerase sigma factor [Ideonella sp. B7]|uniref:sigma-70 family RNA polymerase sigma factor n=1 Tax=Ideonella benzenivorans TaxID=2831643 RepID=UPI001CED0F59|nr:sigma-70 family RNA polymerase sigma factor [Ideonella benzenivorans]MCA6215597.1 sigma-70 family RNA polymerase sigma factor [Ideonella benzenivorans]